METTQYAHGHGVATRTLDGTVLDAWFPNPVLGEGTGPTLTDAHRAGLGADPRRAVVCEPVEVQADLTQPPTDTADAYLRLHLLSHRIVRPNTVNLDGIFAHLPVVAWTTGGPVHPETATARRLELQAHGLQITGLDRFPRMLDYVIPDRVRIADASCVRLGAYLAPGTTVMPSGFVNFNAGTLGASMVEGRISQGVVVGDGSDIGGGASIMGTLSGGGTVRITIGTRSLLGANSGVGISIGDDCIVEAGLYVTAGTRVRLVEAAGERTVKARELSGLPNLLFRRNSETGQVEARARDGMGIALNPALHA